MIRPRRGCVVVVLVLVLVGQGAAQPAPKVAPGSDPNWSRERPAKAPTRLDSSEERETAATPLPGKSAPQRATPPAIRRDETRTETPDRKWDRQPNLLAPAEPSTSLQIEVAVRRFRKEARFSIDPTDGALRWREKPLWLKEEDAQRQSMFGAAGQSFWGRDSVYLIEHLLGTGSAAPWFPGSGRKLPWPIEPPRAHNKGFWPTLRSEETNPGGALRPFGAH